MTAAIKLAEFKKDIQYLTQITKEGFTEIHKRQDIANGKLLKHENKLTKLEGEVDNCLTKEDHLKDKVSTKNKVLYYLFGSAGTIVSGIIIFGVSNLLGG